VITDNFLGITVTEFNCGCNHKTFGFEDTFVLQLPLNTEEMNLRGCLSKFTRKEQMSDYKCKYCLPNPSTIKNSEKSSTLWYLPNVLVLQIKKSRSQDSLGGIDIPLNSLDLSNFFSCYVSCSLFFQKFISRETKGKYIQAIWNCCT
jgi:hypothetical protein